MLILSDSFRCNEYNFQHKMLSNVPWTLVNFAALQITARTNTWNFRMRIRLFNIFPISADLEKISELIWMIRWCKWLDLWQEKQFQVEWNCGLSLNFLLILWFFLALMEFHYQFFEQKVWMKIDQFLMLKCEYNL